MTRNPILWFLMWPMVAGAMTHHHLDVTLEPGRHSLNVVDTITWREPPGEVLDLTLHAGLAPRVSKGAARLEIIGRSEQVIPLEHFRLTLPRGVRTVTLSYGGVIHHPLSGFGQGIGHASEATPGIIAAEGVVLSGFSNWYPQFPSSTRQTFQLNVRLPTGWEAISQGAREKSRAGSVQWRETTPQEEIYLVAGPFKLYHEGTHPEVMVYLRDADPALAKRYLAATTRYLDMYSSLIGAYPYPKFALVENFWETGYGMPSFTLLGSRVIRLPFLIDSAYPHEVLHNWWGNGVYIDYASGNWSEGLTAYLADHLLKEMDGRGAEYRRDQLQAYVAHVKAQSDIPLKDFRGRHSGATQAIGYGKGLMFFHMLRRELGDDLFIAGLRRFYADAKFQNARFEDLRSAFEKQSGRDLGGLFQQWIKRPGAPSIELAEAKFSPGRLRLSLSQTQQESPFVLNVPVVVGLSDGRSIERTVTLKNQRKTAADWTFDGDPVCVSVDPRYDVFRRLLPGELPPTLQRLFGARRLTIVLPSEAPTPLHMAYRQLAQAWAATHPGADMVEDDELGALPVDRPVFLLGWNNRHMGSLQQALPAGVIGEQRVMLDEMSWRKDGHGFVLTAQLDDIPMAWLAADDPLAIAALARKVPHYGKYSYLVFEGAASENRVKGQWPVLNSPLIRTVRNGTCVAEVPPDLVSSTRHMRLSR